MAGAEGAADCANPVGANAQTEQAAATARHIVRMSKPRTFDQPLFRRFSRVDQSPGLAKIEKGPNFSGPNAWTIDSISRDS